MPLKIEKRFLGGYSQGQSYRSWQALSNNIQRSKIGIVIKKLLKFNI